ncbi:MAG: diacylglycerol kinase family protein [Bacteroidota bacterium]
MKSIQENKISLPGRLRTFIYAFNGVKFIIHSQLNFRIHLVAGSVVLLTGFILKLTATEWCILTLTIGLVISMEAINTAIEQLVDFISPEYQKQAGIIKDIAAGAVLLAAITAIVTGLILFIPKIL